MKEKFKLILVYFVVFSSLLVFSGCTHKEAEPDYSNFLSLNVKTSSEKLVVNSESEIIENDASKTTLKNENYILFGNEKTDWRNTNKKIYILYGYDFNAPEIQEKITSLLQKKYGLADENGLIRTFSYPESFKRNGKYYVSDLTAILTECEEDLSGVIILGAPEKTHIALGRVQDYWNMTLPYPIISLFPQDDVLGMESTCDIVLDKAGEISSDELPAEETTAALFTETPEILLSVIDYVLKMQGSLKKDSSVQLHAVQMLKRKRLQYYLDPETGLHSINHFVIF